MALGRQKLRVGVKEKSKTEGGELESNEGNPNQRAPCVDRGAQD